MLIPYAKIGFSQEMSKGWTVIDQAANNVIKKVNLVVDKVKEDLIELKASHDQISASEHYNFEALGQPQSAGCLHPSLKVCSDFRQIFLEMGFTEMLTNNFVESSFRNFDALFQLNNEYLNKVKTVHSKGGCGSQRYGYDWYFDEAKKNVLRTHTTAVSPRMLYGLAKDFKLTKYFKPGMEIFCYHQGLKKWIEIGNSGMFSPEMLLPMGLPEKINVIAWELSLERPTMIKYGINNIRDLVVPRFNLQMVRDNPIYRLDK
ncbi:hypothetical protein QTP88_025391 [Uroleucon formosanum]